MVPSENTAVAVIWNLVVPAGRDGLAGVTIIESRVAAVTVTVVEPEIPLRVAVIGVFPTVRYPLSPRDIADLCYREIAGGPVHLARAIRGSAVAEGASRGQPHGRSLRDRRIGWTNRNGGQDRGGHSHNGRPGDSGLSRSDGCTAHGFPCDEADGVYRCHASGPRSPTDGLRKILRVVPSEKVPVAVRCTVVPLAIEGLMG